MTTGTAQKKNCFKARGKWNCINIVAMVLGFMFFWPIGLLLLCWILSGRDVRELPDSLQALWAKVRGGGAGRFDEVAPGVTDNAVFNEYQQTQYDRIRDIQAEIEARARRFAAFRADAVRRKEEEEFNRFMASAPPAEKG